MKKEENEEGQRKFWKQWSFGLWLITAGVIIVVVPLIVKVVLAKAMPEISGYGGVISAILLLVGLGFWLSKCFRQIGSVEVPSQAVLARFARPVDVVSTGLFFAFCPFEKFKEFPTGQSVMSYKIKEGLYSKEDKEVIIRICAPMDYGPSRRTIDKSDRFHMWDYESDTEQHTLSLKPEQISNIEVLEETFEPSEFVTWQTNWIVPRDWGQYS